MTQDTIPTSGAADRHALSQTFQKLSDQAFCNYIEQIGRDECLEWEHKVKTGKFGRAELTAHTKAGEQLGRHKAFQEAANALTGSNAALVPSQQPAPSPAPACPLQWTPGPNVFKDWCAQWFGPDADDAYLANAVHALPAMAQRFAQPAPTAPTAQADTQPDVDTLAEAEYFIDNPSAWSAFDQRASDAIAAVCKALRASRGQAPAGATEPTEQQILEAAFAPAQPAAEASRFGSPELQAMIIARCVEKDQADSVQEDAARLDWLLLRVSGAEFRHE